MKSSRGVFAIAIVITFIGCTPDILHIGWSDGVAQSRIRILLKECCSLAIDPEQVTRNKKLFQAFRQAGFIQTDNQHKPNFLHRLFTNPAIAAISGP